jgi:hypothetical protein
MAQTRNYSVTLTPAKVDHGSVSYLLFDPNSRKFDVTASSLPHLVSEIGRLAKEEFKRTCAVYCTVPRGERKPPGFDKAVSSVRTIVVEG